MASGVRVMVDETLPAPSRFPVIDPHTLADMKVLEIIDTERIITDRMARVKDVWTRNDPPAGAIYDVENLEFDPIRIVEEADTYFELLLRDRVNQAARAITLAFGSGSDLDGIASRYPGGVPRLALVPTPLETNPDHWETDVAYRRRVWLSPNWLSPHGTADAYVAWALTADPTLRDASAVTTEGTGKVYVTILADSGSVSAMPWEHVRDPLSGELQYTRATPEIMPTPTIQQILDVLAYLKHDGRRGLTDVINVYGPKVTTINYKARVWLFPGVTETLAFNAIESAVAALIEKQRWLGYDHSKMALDAALAQTGVHHAIIDEPFTDTNVTSRGVVRVNLVTISLAGRAE
jgi:phage-related baseplate assembly protein